MKRPSFDAARAICRRHARSFYFASRFLPVGKREAAYSIYAFCRLIDDAVDAGDGDAGQRLDRYVARLDEAYADRPIDVADGSESSLALRAFQWTAREYDLPRWCFVELAEGCRMDLSVMRYAAWGDLERYCYRVAGVVGIIMSRVMGLGEPAAVEQAALMGAAMQLTNILRDVGEDWRRGRVYLPAEDLARFDYRESDLAAGRVNENFKQLMRFEIARARALYAQGAAGLRWLSNDGSRLTASAMSVIYAGILGAIERQDYDVYSERARLGPVAKLRRLPAAWRLARWTGAEPAPSVF